MVVPITADNELLLVREYCAGTHNYQLGFPKGLIDSWRNGNSKLATAS